LTIHKSQNTRFTLFFIPIFLFLSFAVLAQMLFLYYVPRKASPTVTYPLELHFFDVGQGDAALILCNGESLLIDTGTSDSAEYLVSSLQASGIQHLNYLLCTHDHSDHIGGLSSVLSSIPTDYFLYSELSDPAEWESLLSAHGTVSVPLAVGTAFSLGVAGSAGLNPSGVADIAGLNPPETAQVAVLSPSDDSEDENESSMVLRITFGEITALFMADAGISTEEALLETGFLTDIDLLKVGHHGSSGSTGEDFLNCIRPEYAVISAGLHNDYGHPHDELLERLLTAGTQVFRTDLQGDIVFHSDGYTITTETAGDANADTLELTPPAKYQEIRSYVINRKSGVFHKPECNGAKSLKEENRVEVESSHMELAEAGYRPCGLCDP